MNGLTVYVENVSKAQDSLLLTLEMFDHKLTVYGPQRTEFLSPFVHLLKYEKQVYGVQGPRQLAKLLCTIANFCDWDNKQVFVEWQTIEKELIELKKRLYADD